MRSKLISSRLPLLVRAVSVTSPHTHTRTHTQIQSKIIVDRINQTKIENLRHFSSESALPSQEVDNIDEEGAKGDLFRSSIDDTLLNKTASIKRTFGPRSNAQAMLTCGGSVLAKHASFDPQYDRAKSYIRNHAVGPAVLSPVLINGLIGALVEASLPQSFLMSCEMKQHRPLIVGVQVEATINVTSVKEVEKMEDIENSETSYQYLSQSRGYELVLQTEVRIVSDSKLISEGSQHIWLPQDM